MTTKKKKLKLLEKTSDKIKLKFPSIEIPIVVSDRYFKKILNSKTYEIEKSDDVSVK